VSYLIDTDVCSAFLKGDRNVWQKVMQYSGQLHVSAVTAAELFAWALRAKAPPERRQGVLDFLKDTTFLEVDRDVSLKFGEVRASQLDEGQFTPPMDLLIASTALTHGLTLVTHNTQDFVNIAGLTIEDWLTP
jgi:tRNA(fMet)-specific endonuclease VapC